MPPQKLAVITSRVHYYLKPVRCDLGIFFKTGAGGLNSGLRCAMNGIVDLMYIAAELTSKMGYVQVSKQKKMNGSAAKNGEVSGDHC